MTDLAVARKRDAKAEAGKLAGPASHAAGLAHGSGLFHAELPAARKAPAAWGEDGRSGNADLLASDLVADAAEHADSSPGITCAATDTRWTCPAPAGQPDAGRGRGMAIVTARAIASGARAEPGGKTAWFTRRPQPRPFCPPSQERRSRCHTRVTPPQPT